MKQLNDSNKDAIQEFYSKHFDTTLKELYHEANLLSDWFKKDFPESDLKLIIDVDNIRRKFIITCRILMGDEMAHDRGFFENKVILEERDIIKPAFMKSFCRAMGNEYRQEIARKINSYYHQQKEIENG